MNGEPTVIPSKWESFTVTNTINGFMIYPSNTHFQGDVMGPNVVVAETEEHLQAFILAWAIVRKAKRQVEQGSAPKLEMEQKEPGGVSLYDPQARQTLVMKPLQGERMAVGVPPAEVVQNLTRQQLPSESDRDYLERMRRQGRIGFGSAQPTGEP